MKVPQKTLFNSTRFLCAILFAVCFFFIFLGMRNPNLSNDPDPKQRPRAVAEKITKASDRVTKKEVQALEIITAVAVSAPVLEGSGDMFRVFSSPETSITILVARAPPVASHHA